MVSLLPPFSPGAFPHTVGLKTLELCFSECGPRLLPSESPEVLTEHADAPASPWRARNHLQLALRTSDAAKVCEARF